MSLMAPIKDGKVVETESQTSLKKAQTANKNGMDKEAFLQLLVAQMQYQDPLQPTSNTEYISQYAQFSQVEQMQNMAANSELSRATSLVGKEVYIKTTDTSGDANYKFGKVDYVVFEGGKAYLAIEESLYSLDDLDTVVDGEYKAAYDKAYAFTGRLNKLPHVNAIDIDKLEKTFNEMSDYEKTFITKENKDKLAKYIEKLKEVRAAAEDAAKPEEGEGEGGDSTEDGEDKPAEGTEGADKV